MNIPIDRNALAAIGDFAHAGARSERSHAFIDDHMGRLNMFLDALEQQARRMAQAQGEQPSAATPAPPAAPKEPFDPHTPAAQANRDRRREKRLAEQAAREAAQGEEKQSPPD